MCVFIDDETAFGNINFLNSTIKSILTAAIIKGLDIIGILTANDPTVGWKAWQLAKTQQMDITVVPGFTYICQDGEELYIYKIRKKLSPRLPLSQACLEAHRLGGYVIASNVSKRQLQALEKLQGSENAPDAIEIYNAKVGGYRDLGIDFPTFVSSGATSASDLEDSNVFTMIDRKKAEEMKLIAPKEGIDFEPKYLKPKGGQY
jgi:hypothetical protein